VGLLGSEEVKKNSKREGNGGDVKRSPRGLKKVKYKREIGARGQGQGKLLPPKPPTGGEGVVCAQMPFCSCGSFAKEKKRRQWGGEGCMRRGGEAKWGGSWSGQNYGSRFEKNAEHLFKGEGKKLRKTVKSKRKRKRGENRGICTRFAKSEMEEG